MPYRGLRALALAAACLLPLLAACGGPTPAPSANAPTNPLMLDGVYVNSHPGTGPYSQISFIGYLGRYIAEISPCANPDDGSCHEQGFFTPHADGTITLTDDATQHETTLPFQVQATLATPMRPLPPDVITLDGETVPDDLTVGINVGDAGADGGLLSGGSSGLVNGNLDLGPTVGLVTQVLFGSGAFQLTNDDNGMAVSATNPPVQPPIGSTSLVSAVPVSAPSLGSATSPATTSGALAAPGTTAAPTAGTLLSGPTGGAGKIPPNHLMEDSDMIGGTSITADKVQALLKSQNSYLQNANVAGGMSAAQVIVSQAQANGVSPLYIIARIEGESGLIQSSSGRNLQSATGCGCPDGAKCDPTKTGFSGQVSCAAQQISKYIASLNGGGATVSGWKVGGTKASLDPCQVTPDNKSTAATYTYTPWVGAYSTGCGALANGGSTLMGVTIKRYRTALQ